MLINLKLPPKIRVHRKGCQGRFLDLLKDTIIMWYEQTYVFFIFAFFLKDQEVILPDKDFINKYMDCL